MSSWIKEWQIIKYLHVDNYRYKVSIYGYYIETKNPLGNILFSSLVSGTQ